MKIFKNWKTKASKKTVQVTVTLFISNFKYFVFTFTILSTIVLRTLLATVLSFFTNPYGKTVKKGSICMMRL